MPTVANRFDSPTISNISLFDNSRDRGNERIEGKKAPERLRLRSETGGCGGEAGKEKIPPGGTSKAAGVKTLDARHGASRNR